MSNINTQLTKEAFADYILFIRERAETQDKINELFTAEFGDSIFQPYERYETKLIELLKVVMNDTGDWIEYFIYEKKFGARTDLTVTEDGKEIPLNTAEDLYDLITGNYTYMEKK